MISEPVSLGTSEFRDKSVWSIEAPSRIDGVKEQLHSVRLDKSPRGSGIDIHRCGWSASHRQKRCE